MVEWKKLGEVCGIFDGTHQTPKYTDSGIKFVSVENINDLYNSNKYISEEDYNANYKTKPQRNDVLMTRIGDVGSCAIVVKDEPLAYYVSLALLRPNSNVISGYIKYVLGSHIGKVELRKRTLLTAVPLKINLGDVGKVCIPIPSLSEQTRIVEILDTFTSAIDNLKEQIAQRRKQYEYYRDQLLDLEGKPGVEMKRLKDVFYTRNGYTPSTSKEQFWNDGIIPWFKMEDIRDNGRILSDSYLHITPQAVKGKGLFKANSIILATSATIGEHALILVDFLCNQRFTNLSLKENYMQSVEMKYVYYYMFVIDDWCKQHVNQGGFASVDMTGLYNLSIPVPPLSEQQRIVSILDTFEASIQNLEAQLKEREKQYEYYRNKLLTFEGENEKDS